MICSVYVLSPRRGSQSRSRILSVSHDYFMSVLYIYTVVRSFNVLLSIPL